MTERNWFDPNTFAQMFKTNELTKFFDPANIQNLPQFDAQTVVEAQNRNMQAMIDANRIAAEGFQAVFSKQFEIAKANFEALRDEAQKNASAPLSMETVEARAKAAASAFEKVSEDFRALTETARRANEQAFEVLQGRFQESVREFKALSDKLSDAAPQHEQHAA